MGLLTALLIFTNYKSNRVMNLYIILLILIISFRFFLSGLIFFIFDSSFRNTYFKYSNVSFVVIPVCYLYFKDLSKNNHNFEKRDLLHFILPFFFFIYLLKQESFYFVPSNIFPFTLFFIFSLLYVLLCFKILRNHIWSRKGETKGNEKHHQLIKTWTFFLFTGLVLAIFRVVTSIFIELYRDESIKGHSYQWISAVIWLIILFKILITPEILYGYNVLHKKINENKSTNLICRDIWIIASNTTLKNGQHLILKEKINQNLIDYIKEIEKTSFNYEVFRDSKMTISDLALKLNIPKSHLSYLFKYHSKISFSEYKRRNRIHDAINQIELNYLKNNTLESLSKKVGFTSYNPFFTSFKEVSGQSPLEYYKMTKAEVSE